MPPPASTPPCRLLVRSVLATGRLPARYDRARAYGPVGDQGQRETCAAFSCTAAADPCTKSGALSPQHLYHLCKRADGIPTQPGTFLSVGAEQSDSPGCCEDSVWGYVKKPHTPEGGNPGARVLSPTYACTVHQLPNPVTDTDVEAAVHAGFHVVVTVHFFPYRNRSTTYWQRATLTCSRSARGPTRGQARRVHRRLG